jgi:glycosyltransferase involved in cell wall biosynthesis
MKNFGKSQALHAGFAKAKGDVIITMDADLQDSPEEIPGIQYDYLPKF